MSVSPWYNVSCTFMTLTFDLHIKIIFSPWIWVWQNVFALWHRHTKFWHMGVSPWDNMLYTFLTLVWPWPLTCGWRGISLVTFTHSFYLVQLKLMILMKTCLFMSRHFLLKQGSILLKWNLQAFESIFVLSL